MRPVWARIVLAVAVTMKLCAAWLGAGCASDPIRGYAFSSARPSGVRTVHVPIFRNDTYFRGLEIELTDAVVKEIQRSTPWRVVGRDEADTTLSGAITRAELRTLSIARETGLSQEVAVVLAVDFDWTDRRSGRALANRRDFRASEAFVPALGVGERLGVGEQATIDEMAKAIVAELRSQW